MSVQDLCDPARCSLEEALRIAKQRSQERQGYDLQIAHYLNEQWLAPKVDVGIVERTLTLVSETAPPARLFALLRTAMSHHDPHVRSKAAVALARRIDSTGWLDKLVKDQDPRVRANTIESLWGRKSPEFEDLLTGALTDTHHRVAANAAYGLYLMDATKYQPGVEAIIAHAESRYRGAAVWIIGKIGDAKLVPLLKPLLFDKAPEVKRAAFRVLGRLRPAKAVVAA